jgi:sterol desaturase/sphingolipid hydroxylase (fatty acid hydroxylase superfamily)
LCNCSNWCSNGIFYVAFGYGVIGFLSDTLINGPMGELKEAWGIGTPWLAASPFLVQVLVMMFLFEFGQYWMHRAMHNWTPLWLTHAPHHHITQLNAMKGFIGNPIELFLISIGVIALLDVDMNALFAAITAGGAIAIYAHANVRADPPIWYGFFFTTIRHHSLHHTACSAPTRKARARSWGKMIASGCRSRNNGCSRCGPCSPSAWKSARRNKSKPNGAQHRKGDRPPAAGAALLRV